MRQDVQKNKKRELTDDQRLLVISHLPLAYSIAWRMKDCGVSVEDLRQEGCLGLCQAAMRYNENTDCTFAAYASHWCRKMMLLAIDRYGTPVRLPEKEQSAIRFYRLDADENPQEEDEERAADRLLAAPYQEREDEELLRKGQLRRIDDALQCLAPLERQVVKQFYGIDSKRLSLTEIAQPLGFSRARASAIHRHALQKLEAALRERPLADYLSPWLE